MSLVHQVLKDIDQRSGQSPDIPPALRYPQQKSVPVVGWLVALLLVLIILSAAWYFWPTAAEKTAPAEIPGQEMIRPDVLKQPATPQPQQVRPFSETRVAPPLVKTLKEPPASAGQTTTDVEQQAALVVEPQLTIHRPNQQLQQDYLQVIRAMRAADWSLAEQYNNALLTNDKLTSGLRQKALTNKARIFLEQKRYDEFKQFYSSQRDNHNEQWLATVAPGLHIVGAYNEAVDSYRRLSQLQPGVANWPIAMAVALEQNQQRDPARQVLENVLQQYSLSGTQQRWIEQKLARPR